MKQNRVLFCLRSWVCMVYFKTGLLGSAGKELSSWLSPRDVYFIPSLSYEPPHDKTNKMTVRPANTPISLGIHPVWSESSLCAQWIAKDPSFLHADSEDSDQTGRMPRLISVFAGRTCHFVGFVMRRLIYVSFPSVVWGGMWNSIVSVLDRRIFIYFPNHELLLNNSLLKLIYLSTSWETLFYVICEQQRLRSACASAKSDQHLCCSLPR